MAELIIARQHTLGLERAKAIAAKWQEEGEQQFDLVETARAEDATHLTVCFARTGLNGELIARADEFVLTLQLGFLLSAFQGRIETVINQNLDALLAPGGEHH